jgi:polyisoprenoid-binding protein YceI
MKIYSLLFCVALFVSLTLQSQTLIDREGTTSFFSEAPLENIQAENKKVSGAINLDEGTLAVSMFITDFKFENSLMEEHFNENYLESEKFPKATFSGKIVDFGQYSFKKESDIKVMVSGKMKIHGVEKPMEISVDLKSEKKRILANTSFPVSVADFGIKIPNVVVMNIAEIVEVTSSFEFEK